MKEGDTTQPIKKEGEETQVISRIQDNEIPDDGLYGAIRRMMFGKEGPPPIENPVESTSLEVIPPTKSLVESASLGVIWTCSAMMAIILTMWLAFLFAQYIQNHL